MSTEEQTNDVAYVLIMSIIFLGFLGFFDLFDVQSLARAFDALTN